MYLLIGGAAYFLLFRGSALGSLFGGAVAVPGYTSLGGNYYRNNSTGTTVVRDPSTGNMTTSTGAVIPAGTPAWLAPTVAVGTAAIPQIGVGLAQGLVGALVGGVNKLFAPSSTPAAPSGGPVSGALPDLGPLSGGAPAPDVMGTGYVPPTDVLPALPPLPGPDVATVDMSMTLTPIDTSSWFSPADAVSGP